MNYIKPLVIFLLLTFSCGDRLVIAQQNESSTESIFTEQTEEENSQQTTTQKKDKDKKKNDVEINTTFFLSLLINILTILIIIILIYYPNNKHFENIFSFIMFNVIIFMLTFVLNKIKLSMGAAFGLFAVFSMLRYRTEGISMKDMTYLFIFIGIGLISAIRLDYHELGIINASIIIITFVLDSNRIFKRENSKYIDYENIELTNQEHYQELIDDLKQRTGLNIHRFEIERYDFLRDSAKIKIYYYEK